MSGNSERVLDILAFLVEFPGGATLKEVVEGTGISRATAFRTLNSMAASGWLLSSGSPSRFAPSRRVAQLGLAMLRHDDVHESVLPNAIDLARAVRCVCMLGFFESPDVVYTDAIEVFGERVMPTPSGMRIPAYATACGRMLLSMQTEQVMEDALAGLPNQLPDGTPVSRSDMEEELAKTRTREYAISAREFRPTASGIAVPVFGRDGRVAAAIGIHADDGADDEFISRVLPTAREFARKASMELGHRSSRTRGLS